MIDIVQIHSNKSSSQIAFSLRTDPFSPQFPIHHSPFFTDVHQIPADARRSAYTAVNSAMVEAYWQIRRRIVEEEQGGQTKATYGEGLLRELSKALTTEFGKGFSYANLRK